MPMNDQKDNNQTQEEQDSTNESINRETNSSEDLNEQEDSSENDAEDTIEKLKAELEEMKNRWMRSEAERQNLRNRTDKEIQNIKEHGIQKFARDIVEAEENLERALASLPPKEEGEPEFISSMRTGLESTENSFINILKKHGIVREDANGQKFDPNQHQAMQQITSEDHAPGDIVKAWSPVWKLHNRLLKPAMVIVANDDSTGENKDAQ